MNTNNSNETHCAYNNFRKARYFDGEILDKQIFISEQIYHNDKRKLLNKMLHGWGVVCGLKVKATNPPSSKVIVEPGLALDCNGYEIHVCEEQTIDLSVKTCTQKQDDDPCSGSTVTIPKDTALFVVIKYKEISSDPVPSYAPSGNCGEKTCDYSRTREGFCIEVWDKLPPTPKPNSTEVLCSESFKCPTCCPDPHYLVLATIRCGDRTDRVFSSSTDKTTQVGICYQITRVLHQKVCINNADPNDIINVDDIYIFETDQKLDNIQWEATWPQQKPGDKLKISMVSEGDKSTNIFKINYNISSLTSAKGSVDMEIPVSLTLTDISGNISNFNLSIQSSIYIGKTEPKLGSIISDIMIRNMENRQLVITYPFLSWLVNSSGSKEGQIFSHNMSSICESMDMLFYSTKELINNLEKQLIESRSELDNLKKTVTGIKASMESEKKPPADSEKTKTDATKKSEK